MSNDSPQQPVAEAPHPATQWEDAETLSFLNRLTDTVLGQTDPEQIISAVQRMLGLHLNVSRVLVAEASSNGEVVSVPQIWAAPGMPPLQAAHRLADYGDRLLSDYRAGRTHIRRDAEREYQAGPELDALRAIRALASIDVPVVVGGNFRALFVVHQATPRDWTEGEIALVRQVADRLMAEVERARALREAQESEARFRQMADAMPQIVWAAGPDGTVEYYNRKWYEFTGLPEGAIGDPSWQVAFHEEDVRRSVPVWQTALQNGQPFELEVRLRRSSDDCYRWFLNRGLPARDSAGSINRWFGTLTDVHDQRMAAEVVRRNELRLSSALAVADLGTFDWDVRTDAFTMDARSRELFGFSATQPITSTDVFARVDRSSVERVHAALITSIQQRSRLEVEYEVTLPDGTRRTIVSISNVADGSDGNPERLSGVFGDITTRKRIEEERERFLRTIEAERSNLAAVVEKAPAFICVLRGPDHVFELANDDYYLLVGRRDLIGMRVRDALPEVEGQGFFEMLDSVYHTGESVRGTEVPVIVGPKEMNRERHRFVNFVYQALRGPDGNVNGIFVHGVDATEAVRAREAIAISERRRRLASDAAGVGSFNIDITTQIMESDENFRTIFGCTDGSLTYEQALALIHPDDLELVRDKVAAATRPVDPEPYTADYRVIHPDGSVHWVLARGGVKFEGTGADRRLVSFDGTVADITDRKRAENELAFQRHQLELIFRESPAAMAIWRGEDLVFERVNPVYQELFRERSLMGKPLLEAIPELRGQGFEDLLLKVLRTGEPFTGHEVLARIARGPGDPVEDSYFDFMYSQVRDPDGRPYGVYNHSVDVTDRVLARRALEESRQQLQQALSERQILLDAERAARRDAEQAGRMKDEFLATLSHELRTPLNAIVGWTEILKSEPEQSEDLAEGLKVIARNAKAQTQIVEDILDMSRILSGKLRLDVQKVDLPALVKAGAETMQPAADAKEVRLQVIVDSSAGPVHGDPNRLQQVFWNLVSNAVKFTPKGGRVQVTLQRVESHLEVTVTDTGGGIAPDFLPHVFDRFRQADATTTRRHGGLGLGLSIVKQIVELHGGSVYASSPGKGQGATFSVHLPLSVAHVVPGGLAAAPAEHPEAEVPLDTYSAAGDRLKGVSVVAVDDEPDSVAMIHRLLTACGATVRTAITAAEALELIHVEPPMVLVSDIGMPGEDGYALIRKVRALPPERGGRVSALALTAYARTVDRMRALESGFQMHISKPVEPAELIVSVAALATRFNGK